MKRLAVGASIIAALVLPPVVLAGGNLPLGKYTTNVKISGQAWAAYGCWNQKGGKYTITDHGWSSRSLHVNLPGSISTTRPAACPHPGVYGRKRTGKTLKFTKVSDPCVGRAVVLDLPFTATG